MKFSVSVLLLISLGFLSACSGGGSAGQRAHRNDGAPPSVVKVGDPYTVMGKTYTPKVQLDYDEVGMASWYGPGFHGKYTANGERFDSKGLTAAHATLPLPSMVRVTDLLTGKSIIARVNDRGPFSDKRIIDLSEGSARALGVKGRGIAQVRVQFLPEETEQYLASISTPDRPVQYPAPLSRIQPAPLMVADASPDVRDDPAYANIRESRNVTAVAPVAPVEQSDLAPVGRSESSKNDIARTSQRQRDVLVADNNYSEPQPVLLEGDETLRPLPQVDTRSLNNDRLAPQGNRDMHENALPLQSQQQARSSMPGRMPFARAIPPDAPPPPPIQATSVRSAGQQALSPRGGVYVQAGTFSIVENAQHLADRLSQLGPSGITQQTINGHEMYRVRVGPLEQTGDAQDILREINALGITDAKIIHDQQ